MTNMNMKVRKFVASIVFAMLFFGVLLGMAIDNHNRDHGIDKNDPDYLGGDCLETSEPTHLCHEPVPMHIFLLVSVITIIIFAAIAFSPKYCKYDNNDNNNNNRQQQTTTTRTQTATTTTNNGAIVASTNHNNGDSDSLRAALAAVEQQIRADKVRECLEFRMVAAAPSSSQPPQILSKTTKPTKHKTKNTRGANDGFDLEEGCGGGGNRNDDDDDDDDSLPSRYRRISIAELDGGGSSSSWRRGRGGRSTRREEACSICLEPFVVGDRVARMKPPTDDDDDAACVSHHWFKEDCIVGWLQNHDECPLSRIRIVPED